MKKVAIDGPAAPENAAMRSLSFRASRWLRLACGLSAAWGCAVHAGPPPALRPAQLVRIYNVPDGYRITKPVCRDGRVPAVEVKRRDVTLVRQDVVRDRGTTHWVVWLRNQKGEPTDETVLVKVLCR
jgi:hypothetical protein